MATAIEETFRELMGDTKKFIESLLIIENKARQQVPFTFNPIQQDVYETQTGRDIWIKPSQVGFSSERIATRLVDTLINPGTNTVLVAYEEFITERLLSKVTFFYNHLASLDIPGFPEMHHDSTYEKTFRFYVNNRVVSTSSIYIASARSYVAGRAETIHHLLCDEFGFWVLGAVERILLPAIARIPPEGTCDIFSTPNGEDNDFHDIYILAKEGKGLGKSVFTPHFYAWFQHPEYQFGVDDPRCNYIPECKEVEFELFLEEQQLINAHNLSFDQIRWRRWKVLEMESLHRTGETRMLFPQEFPEDDVSCFLSTGDMYYDTEVVNQLAKGCCPAEIHRDGAHIWLEPEKDKHYIIAIDPGQAKIAQSAITVLCVDGDKIKYCARDAGLYGPEITKAKADSLATYYNNGMEVWEANSHGLALSVINKYRNVYYRKDIVSGRTSTELGWLTTPKTKDYMLHTLHRALPFMEVYDIEFISQLRNLRMAGDKIVSVGLDDIHDSVAIGLVCRDPAPGKRGYMGRYGYKW